MARLDVRVNVLLCELLAQDTDQPSIDVDQTERLRRAFDSLPASSHLKILERMAEVLSEQQDERFPVLAFPVDSLIHLNCSNWQENLKQTTFAVPTYYLRKDADFFVEAAEEERRELPSPVGLRAVLREWRGLAELEVGDRPYRCIFVWPHSLRD